jgi:hypothetical protein
VINHLGSPLLAPDDLELGRKTAIPEPLSALLISVALCVGVLRISFLRN